MSFRDLLDAAEADPKCRDPFALLDALTEARDRLASALYWGTSADVQAIVSDINVYATLIARRVRE